MARFPCFLLLVLLTTVSSLTPSDNPKVTISVCTGPDCRVDGASDTLRQLQKCASPINKKNDGASKVISVKARSCLGPCGDGPCVQVLNAQNQKVYTGEQPNRIPSGTWIESDAFGADTKRTYQVQNADQVDFVMSLAGEEAGLTTTAESDVSFQATSTRTWYDRNNNERKVLQRLTQLLIVWGLVSYQDSSPTGEIGNLQWTIAFALVLATNYIMKDNLLEQLFVNLSKKNKSS